MPGPAGLVAAGFALRSVHCVRGRHLYLSALPDGLLTTVLASRPPSRWEIFSIVDLQVRTGCLGCMHLHVNGLQSHT